MLKILTGLFLCLILASPCSFSALSYEERAAYRSATAAQLIAESQRKKDLPRHAPGQNQKDTSAYFALGNDSPLSLEPVNASAGDVIGA